MARNDFGPFRKFSLAGFLALGLLYIVDVLNIAAWPVSPELTGGLALLAGIGAVLLWFGNDPTRSDRRETESV